MIPKLTPDQAKVIMAFTGYAIGDFSKFHEYAEQLFGRPVFTHEFANPEIARELRELSRHDFCDLAPEQV